MASTKLPTAAAIKRLCTSANTYRKSTGHAGGVVVFFDGIPTAWVNELRNPEHWEPGCIALDQDSNAYIATGGDSHNGAILWDALAGAPAWPQCNKNTLKTLSETPDATAAALLNAIDNKTPTPPKLGEHWPLMGGIYAGVIRYPNGEQYHLCTIKADIKSTWGKYGTNISGATSKHDGLANTIALREAKSTLVAALDAALSDADQGHAYIPAIRELNIITANLGDTLPPHWHWSSTQCGAYHAWVQDFSDGYQSIDHKDIELAALAVRRLPI